ncbi:MAG: hypothetical protein JXQ82_09705 [Methanomicrobiaceae archaeon]|nr:hypothetical protein [Methanomicrobiaceae archaeon]
MAPYNAGKIAVFQNRFNLVNADEDILLPALESIINQEQRPLCLYICGIYPWILPKLRRDNVFHLRRAANPYQILTILNEASHKLIIIEHDPSIYDGKGEVAEEIGRRCNEIAKDATVIYFWPFSDVIIRRYVEKSAAVITILNNPVAKKGQTIRLLSLAGQTTLDRVW